MDARHESLLMKEFIGRKEELKILHDLYENRGASFVVIRGRRRIGKSRLVEEFGKGKTFHVFTGLPVTAETTAQSQRESFAKQLKKIFGIAIKADDWWDLLWFLAERTQKGKTVIFFDEISWLGSKDPDFLGKLKAVWDNHFKKSPRLMLILCGSISSWIDKNIISSSGFMGRISSTINLQELSLQECNDFWGINKKAISAFEKLKVLSVTGGIPRYLEDIRPKSTAESNIQRMCFSNNGILFYEFEQIFSDLFSSRSEIYKRIVTNLAEGRATREEIALAIDIKTGGVISKYLDDLQTAGFIARDFSWRLQDGKMSTISYYRLSDNYLRFYLKYILPNKKRIEAGAFKDYSLTLLPAWNSIMGLQFENLVLNNRQIVKNILKINAADVVFDGPYFQKNTARHEGCQIDYMVQTKHRNLYICEIKFSQREIKPEITTEVQQKIARLKCPKGFSYRPILIHANEVHPEVEDSGYFAQIIDFGSLLEPVI